MPSHAGPYFDVDALESGKYATLLKSEAKKLGLADGVIKGSISASWVNTQISTLNEGKDDKDKVAAIDKDALAKMERGLAYHHFFKTSQHTILGSRYLVLQDAYETYAKVRYKASKGKSEIVLGEKQRKWFLDSVKASKQTWKIWGNEYCLLKRVADLTPFPDSVVSSAFRQRFLLSAEDWDGFPNRRDEIIGALSDAGNVVAVTGDIHAFFASTPWVSTDPTRRVVEFVTGAVSSSSYKSLLLSQATSNQTLIDAGAASLAAVADKIILGDFAEDPAKRPNPHLGYTSVDRNGCVVVEADGKELIATFFEIFEGHNDENLGTGDKLDKAFGYVRFKVAAGSTDLHREEGSAWKRWDSDKCAWV